MKKNQIVEEHNLEEDFIDITTEVIYKGEVFRFIQYGDMKLVLKQVKENGKISYQVPPVGIREEVIKLMSSVVIFKVKEKEECKGEESHKLKTDDEKKLKKKKKAKIVVPLLLATGILVSLHKYNRYYYVGDKYYYVGIDYDELLKKLSENNSSFQEVLSSINFLDNEYYGNFSESEKEEFRNRAERFSSCLTEEEKEVFKYQLDNLIIRKGGSSTYVTTFENDTILYIKGEIHEVGHSLEYAFCELMQNCYIDDKRNYYVFENQQFLERGRVNLGDHFPFYNNILFLYYNYPEYQERISRVLESEGFLYYQLVLQTLDANLVYLPFNYQMEDVLKAYQEVFSSKGKAEKFLGQVGSVQSFENQGNFWDYELRNSVVVLSNEYFIEREKQIVDQYFTSILKEGKSDFSTQELIEELSNRYRKYSSLIEQINKNSEVKFNSIYDFKRDYPRKVLSHVYVLGRTLQMIPEDMTYEELKSSFFDRVYEEENKNDENIDGSLETGSVNIYQKIFHYPLSTQ